MWRIVTTGLSQAQARDGWKSLVTLTILGRKSFPHMRNVKDAENHLTSDMEAVLKIHCNANFSRGDWCPVSFVRVELHMQAHVIMRQAGTCGNGQGAVYGARCV